MHPSIIITWFWKEGARDLDDVSRGDLSRHGLLARVVSSGGRGVRSFTSIIFVLLLLLSSRYYMKRHYLIYTTNRVFNIWSFDHSFVS